METTVKERIVTFLSKMKISQKKFETACGLSNGYVNGLKKSPGADVLQKIFGAYPMLNQDWLIKGEGEMINNSDKNEPKGIPLIPVNAIAGYISGMSDPIMDYDCERYIIPIFRGADFLIRVEGDSMMPEYAPGDLLACVRLKDPSFFQCGKVYVIDTKQGALVKRIEPAEEDGCIMLCSENEKYKPFKLCADDINGVALVRGVIKVV